ncbi:MAG: rhodanese-like domain-containing protein [Planctomycetota bacterium]|nr:rhodanese-like domain-containing protein [Planctomycetota bacterium]
MTDLTTAQLVELRRGPTVSLVDARPVDAYNGWRLREEPRGGHIAGARSLPRKWTRYIDWPDIVQAKGLLPADTVVVYGYEEEEAEAVARQFERAGCSDVRLYHRFVDEWCADDGLPMDRLPRYRHLVPPQWLHTLLQTGAAPEYRNDRHFLCHAHYQNRGAYDEGHIPGAIELDTNALEDPETWNRRSPRQLEEALERAGITHDTTVILYGRFSFPDYSDPFPGSSAGHLGAIRCALILLYAGVEDVRVLNGGLQSWIDEGFETTTEETPRRPVADFGRTVPRYPELIVDLPQAKEMLRASGSNLVSVRSWREFIGEVSGYHYIEKKGRIPGAVFGNCGSDAYHMENYRNVDHTTREYHEIEANWAEVGVTPDKHNAFYCGTGWRGSEAFFNAWLMGWPRISVFDGGWYEWSRDDRNPCEAGVPAAPVTRAAR